MEKYYGRESFIETYQKLLRETTGTQFLMTGKWGTGKTVIVNKIISNINDISDINIDEEGSAIKLHKAIRIDAWENDYVEDPNLLLLSELFQNDLLSTDEFKAIPKSNASKTGIAQFLKTVANELAENTTGIDVTSAVNQLKSSEQLYYDSSLEQLNQATFYRTMAEKTLTAVISEKYESLTIFIDEIDRCKPDFALRLIERFHHLDVGKSFVKFVYVSDKNALIDIVDNYYGFGNRSFEYLEKMFDSIIEVPVLTPYEMNLYFKSIYMPGGVYHSNYYLGALSIADLVNFFYWNDMTFRNINRFCEDILKKKFSLINSYSYYSTSALKRNYQNEKDLLSDQNNSLVIDDYQIVHFYQFLILLQFSNPLYKIGIKEQWFNSKEYGYKLIKDYFDLLVFFKQTETILPDIKLNTDNEEFSHLEAYLSNLNLSSKNMWTIKRLYGILDRLINKDDNFSNLIY